MNLFSALNSFSRVLSWTIALWIFPNIQDIKQKNIQYNQIALDYKNKRKRHLFSFLFSSIFALNSISSFTLSSYAVLSFSILAFLSRMFSVLSPFLCLFSPVFLFVLSVLCLGANLNNLKTGIMDGEAIIKWKGKLWKSNFSVEIREPCKGSQMPQILSWDTWFYFLSTQPIPSSSHICPGVAVRNGSSNTRFSECA